MRLRHLVIALLASGQSCAPQPGAGQASEHASTSAPAPSDIVRDFIEATRSSADADLTPYLTAASIAAMADGSSSFDGAAIDGYTLGLTSVAGDTARQSVTMNKAGEEQTLDLVLRKETAGWRIHGMVLPFEGDGEWTIDFESEAGPLGGLGEQLGEALGAAIEESFGAEMENWMAESRAERARQQNDTYEQIASVSVGELQPGWSGTVRGMSRPAGEVLAEILDGTGLQVESGEFDRRLSQVSRLRLTGVSRIEALEALAREVGLTLNYDSLSGRDSDAPAGMLGWSEGVREPAMSFSGPFGIQLSELEENAPLTTGSISVTAISIGMPPALLAGNARMFECLRLASVTGSGAVELLEDPEMRMHSQPSSELSALRIELDYDLIGLLSGVREIESVRGDVRLNTVGRVHKVEFDSTATTLELGGCTAQLEWQDSTLSVVFDDAADLEGFAAHAAAWGANGEPFELNGSSAYGWDARLQVDIWFDESPAKLGLCFFQSEAIEFPFELGSHALEHYTEQPLARTELEFSGKAPIEIEFASRVADSDPEFPEADFKVRNLCNKDVQMAQAQFVYLDARGNELGDFPHTLQGEYSFEGPSVLVADGSSADLRTVTFFAPAGTERIEVRLQSAEFTDGTTWSAAE